MTIEKIRPVSDDVNVAVRKVYGKHYLYYCYHCLRPVVF